MILQGFEAGTLGATISSGDIQTAGDTAATAVGVDSGATFTYSNTHAAHGTKAAKITSAGATAQGKWAISGDAGAARFYLYLSAAMSSSETRLFHLSNGFTALLRLKGLNNGYMRLDAGGSTAWTSPTAIPAGEWIRVEIAYRRAAGEAKVAIYSADSTTAISDSGWMTGLALGSTNPDGARFGVLGTATPVPDLWMDSVAVDITATDYIGPATVPNVDPIVSVVGPASLPAGDAGTVTATASDSGGTIASYAWGTTAGVLSGSGASVTLTNDANRLERTATVTCTVTNDGGATAQATHDVTFTGAPVVLHDGTNWTPAARRLP